MAIEDRSVRGLVQDIDKRTKDLEPVLEKLSKSLDKIADSFGGKKVAEKFKAESRESLLSKFQTPVLGGGKPGADVGTSIKDLGELLTRNHKESFEIFKSIDSTLKKIQEKGGTVGGGLDINIPGLPGKKGKPGAPAKAGAQAAAGGAGRFLSKAVPIAAAGMAAFDAYSGYQEAAENLDIKDREATLGEKLSSAAGSAVSGLTFGLLDKKKASQGIAGFFGAGPDRQKAPPTASTAELEGITAPSPQFDIEAPPPISVKAPTPEVKVEAATPIAVPATAAVTSAALAPAKETKAAVTPAPKATTAPSTKPAAKGPSLNEQMEGDANLEKFQIARGDLQQLQEEYKDAKFEVQKEFGNKKETRGSPEHKAALKAVDDKYLPLIEAQKKEVEKLSKAPGVKEAQVREKESNESFDKALSGDKSDLDKPLAAPSVKPNEKFIVTQESTLSESGGGSTTTTRVRSADAQAAQKEMAGIEGKQEKEREQMVAKLQKEGKIKEHTIDDYENIPELKELVAKQENERASIQARMDKGSTTETTRLSPIASTTTTSSTVGNISQENMDMLQRDVESGKPIVINNTSTMSTNTSSIAPIRTLPRPSNNSFERKQSSVASF